MLRKTTAFVGGALVLSSVVFTSVSAHSLPRREVDSGQGDSSIQSVRNERKKDALLGVASHGIVTGLTDDGFFMEARTRTGPVTVRVHVTNQTVFKRDRGEGTSDDVLLGSRLLVRGQKDALGTTQYASSVRVIKKSFGTHPFPERLAHKGEWKFD